MAAIKGKDTKPELAVRRMLHRRGFRYVLRDRRLPGTPDLVFPARRKVIFVHGCHWHMHACRNGQHVERTRVEFWQTKRKANVARDARNTAELERLGWRVHVVWECEVRDGTLIERLVEFLERR